MRFAALGLLLAGLASVASPTLAQQPAASAAVDSARLEQGRQVVAIMYPAEKRQAMMGSLIESVVAQYRASMTQASNYNDPGLKQIVDQSFAALPQRLMPTVQAHLPRLFEAMARAYARNFTAAELQEVLTFGRTATGRHFLQNSTTLMNDGDVAAANNAYYGQLQQLNQQITADFRRNVTSYLQSHPDVAARLRNQNGTGR